MPNMEQSYLLKDDCLRQALSAFMSYSFLDASDIWDDLMRRAAYSESFLEQASVFLEEKHNAMLKNDYWSLSIHDLAKTIAAKYKELAQ